MMTPLISVKDYRIWNQINKRYKVKQIISIRGINQVAKYLFRMINHKLSLQNPLYQTPLLWQDLMA